MTENQLYGVLTLTVTSSTETAENVMNGAPAVENTENQLYRMRSTGDDITMEVDGPKSRPSLSVEDPQYDYVRT